MSPYHIFVWYTLCNMILAIISVSALAHIRDVERKTGILFIPSFISATFVSPRIMTTWISSFIIIPPIVLFRMIFRLKKVGRPGKIVNSIVGYLDHVLLLWLSIPLSILSGTRWSILICRYKKKRRRNK
jgi:hypothetical protein